MTETTCPFRLRLVALALLAAAQLVSAQGRAAAPRAGDYIVAVVNQELVTAVEVEQRLARVRDEAGRAGARLPPVDELRRQIVDTLIEERAITTYARDSGMKIDEAQLDRAVQSVAAQNQLSVTALRERLQREGVDFGRFRSNLRDQMLFERVREREVYQRIRITDLEVDAFLERQRGAAQADAELNVAQILVTVPEGAGEAVVAQRRARAEQALTRVRAGEAFDAVARELSEDGNRERGGEIGVRPASRLPDVFVDAVRTLQPGQIAPALLRSGAGFHVLKLIERRDGGSVSMTQTRARHILLRPSDRVSVDDARRRLDEYRRQIASGARRFEDLARQVSEDTSAPQGGDLGWAAPGSFVPEFEEAMNALDPGGVSAPMLSRFGMHLIQVVERRQVALDPKQLREQARNVLREQKFETAYNEWVRDLRARAYVELREPPL